MLDYISVSASAHLVPPVASSIARYLEWRSALAVYPAALLTWKPYRVRRPGSDRPVACPTLALFIHAAAVYASLILISPY